MSDPITPAQFRDDFPAFADRARFSDNAISMYLTLASKLCDQHRFQDAFTMAQELYAAHHLALDAIDERSAAKGGIPGQDVGIVTAKSVGSLSKSMDASASLETDAGFWNQTTYGRRFIRLARMAGTGGVQVSGVIPYGRQGWPVV